MKKKNQFLLQQKQALGKGSPNKQGKESSHGSPLGEDELKATKENIGWSYDCLLYTSPSPRDRTRSRMPSSA